MRKVSLFLIVALAAAASFSTPALAQDKAAEVLANVRKALGAGKVQTFSLEAKTARNVGERQMTSDIEIYLALPDKYLRVENITAPVPRTTSMGFNGEKAIRPSMGGPGGGGGNVVVMNGVMMGGGGGGAMVAQRGSTEVAVAGRGGGAPAPLTPEQEAMMNNSLLRGQRVELSRYMLGWFGQAHPGLNVTYTYAGEAESPDGKAHIIHIKADGGFDAKLFVDQATSIPLMLTYQGAEPRIMTPGRAGGAGAAGVPPPPPPPPPPGAHGGMVHTAPPAGGQAQMTQEEMQKQLEAMRNTPPKMVEYRIYFTDWKEVDGIQFPHVLQRAVAGTTTEEWTISKVKVNPKIDPKKFS